MNAGADPDGRDLIALNAYLIGIVSMGIVKNPTNVSVKMVI